MPVFVKAYHRAGKAVGSYIKKAGPFRKKIPQGWAVTRQAGKERSIEHVSKTKSGAFVMQDRYTRGARSSSYISGGKVVKERFRVKPYYGK